MRERLRAAALGVFAACLLPNPAVGDPTAAAAEERPSQADADQPQVLVEKGIRIEFRVDAVGAAPRIREGDYAEVRFQVSDAETGAPISPLEPAVWISQEQVVGDSTCRERIGRYIQGMLSFQADIDLNKYFILIMNNDQSISVVDPLLGVSGVTQLYTMIVLKDRAEDWTRSADQKLMYVSIPRAGLVAIVDLDDFEVLANVEVGERPVRLAIQPDGRYLWVGDDAEDGKKSGVTVVDLRSRKVVARIPTGAGHHEIAFDDDGLLAFVTNDEANTVSVIDIAGLARLRDVELSDRPIGVQFSPLSRAAYVATEDGRVTTLVNGKADPRKSIALAPGLRAFEIDPSGRWGFGAQSDAGRVAVFDVSSGALAHRLSVGAAPHEFAFTDTYAYVRHLGTAEVSLIPLAQLGLSSQPGVQSVPFGTRAPGEYEFPAEADSISPTGEWTSVVAANPADKLVFYYMEGMIAPMGSYSTYGRVPRAVSIVDRSVRETAKGVYSAKFRVPGSGDFDVAFLIDSPWVDHCFSFHAEPDPQAVGKRAEHPARIEFLDEKREMGAGVPWRVRFMLTSSTTGEPLAGLTDVVVLATRLPGSWQRRQPAEELGQGRYQVEFTPDAPGVYYVSVAVPSLGVDFTELPFVTFRAHDATREKQGE